MSRFLVKGAMRESGEDVSFMMEGKTRQDVENLLTHMGVLVERIEISPDASFDSVWAPPLLSDVPTPPRGTPFLSPTHLALFAGSLVLFGCLCLAYFKVNGNRLLVPTRAPETNVKPEGTLARAIPTPTIPDPLPDPILGDWYWNKSSAASAFSTPDYAEPYRLTVYEDRTFLLRRHNLVGFERAMQATFNASDVVSGRWIPLASGGYKFTVEHAQKTISLGGWFPQPGAIWTAEMTGHELRLADAGFYGQARYTRTLIGPASGTSGGRKRDVPHSQ